MPCELKFPQVFQGLTSSCRAELAHSDEAAKDLSHFKVDQMRRVEVFVVGEVTLAYHHSVGRSKKDFDQRRGVDHNHRPSRSARTAAAVDSVSRTRVRRLILRIISSMVGVFAARSACRSMKSESERPAVAARAFSLR